MQYVSEPGKGITLHSAGALTSARVYFELDALLVNQAFPEMRPVCFVLLWLKFFTRNAGLGSSGSFHTMVSDIRECVWVPELPSSVPFQLGVRLGCRGF